MTSGDGGREAHPASPDLVPLLEDRRADLVERVAASRPGLRRFGLRRALAMVDRKLRQARRRGVTRW